MVSNIATTTKTAIIIYSLKELKLIKTSETELTLEKDVVLIGTFVA
jgi:hypothetical protein